ncbi:MAG: DUF1461 domain-containing protein [Bacilli bacterium]|jgi:integral membrane protein (TIGR01906 family)
MKVLHKTVIAVATVSLLLLLFYLSVMPIAMSKWFYMMNYENYQADDATGYSMEELSEITDIMLDYLKDKRDSMQHEINGKEVYSEQAIIHMEDVKVLFVGARRLAWFVLALFIASIIYIVYYFKELKSYLMRTVITASAVAIGLVVMAGAFAAVNFDVAFVWFHKVIFPNQEKFENAFFDPDDFLINMLQGELFFNFAIVIIVTFIILIAIVVAGLYFFQKKYIDRVYEN